MLLIFFVGERARCASHIALVVFVGCCGLRLSIDTVCRVRYTISNEKSNKENSEEGRNKNGAKDRHKNSATKKEEEKGFDDL